VQTSSCILMQFLKRPRYLREGKPRHLRVNRRRGPETPLDRMAPMQVISPQGEQGALGLESPLGRITHAATQMKLHLPYLHPNHDQWILPHSPEVQTPQRNPSLYHPYLLEGTPLPQEKVWSGSPLLTRSLTTKKRGSLTPTKRNQHEPQHQH